MICRVCAILILIAAAVGCSSKSYTLTIERKEPKSLEAASSGDVIAVVERAAMGNRFYRVATPNDLDVRLRSYRADVKSMTGKPGVIRVNVNQPKTDHFDIVMATSPNSDYAEARAFRSQVKHDLMRLLPNASIRGF